MIGKPFLTKLWWGRWWVYVRTKKKYPLRTIKLGYHAGIVSHKRSDYA